MKSLLILLLIFVILISGCVEQETLVTTGTKDGVKIKGFSFDRSSIYAGDPVGLNLEIQNVGDVEAELQAIKIYGLMNRTVELKTDDILSPGLPNENIEGESQYYREIFEAPYVSASTTFNFGARVEYRYRSIYTGTLRVVEGSYLESLSAEDRDSLLDNSGVISASVTGGPLSVSPVKGRGFIVDGGSMTRPILFKVTNAGSGYTYTGSIETGNYQVTITSDGLEYCGIVEGGTPNPTIKLSKGKSRIFSCNFTTPSEVVNKMDVIFSISFDYNYYVDGTTTITIEPSG